MEFESSEHLIRRSSEVEADHSTNRKETVLVQSTNSVEGTLDPVPSYADGVRVILLLLDKHRVDIEKALCYAKNSHTYDDLCEKVITGKLLFMPLARSIMLCEVTQLPNFKVFHCFIAAGDLDELLTVGTTQLGVAAKAHGCKYISICGRRGWEPHLKKQGWDAPLTVMYKEVTYEPE